MKVLVKKIAARAPVGCPGLSMGNLLLGSDKEKLNLDINCSEYRKNKRVVQELVGSTTSPGIS